MRKLVFLVALIGLSMGLFGQVKVAPADAKSNSVEIFLPAKPDQPIMKEIDKERNDVVITDARPQPNFLNPPKSGNSTRPDVQIGTGTTQDRYPIDPFWGYNYTQNIYYASEIGTPGLITKIKYYFAGTNMANAVEWVVYMGHTNKTVFSSTTDWIPVTQLTQVFNGTVNWAPNSWIEITLQNPFFYNGTDNLVIAVDENTPGYHTSSDRFYCTQITGNRGIRYSNDGTNPDPANPPTASAISNYIANIIISLSLPYNDNLAVARIEGVSKYLAPDLTQLPKVRVLNLGQNPRDSFDVYLTIVNTLTNDTLRRDTIQYRDVNNPVALGGIREFTFPAWSPAIGEYKLIAQVKIIDAVDENPADDTKEALVYVNNFTNMTNGQMTTCSRLFFDSGGPDGDYGNNQNLTFTFLPQGAGKMIRVEFLEFDTEDKKDTLIIYNGPNTQSPLIGKWFGKNSPGVIVAQNPQGALTFNFKSDGSNTRPGWAAKVSCFTPPANDLALVSIDNIPAFMPPAQQRIPRVTIFNAGSAAQDTFDIILTITNIQTNAVVRSDTIFFRDTANPLAPLTSRQFSFPAWTPTDGEYTLVATVLLEGDGNLANNQKSLNTFVGVIVNMSNGETTTCNALFYDSGGPNATYSINENLVHTFLPSIQNAFIKVQFSEFDTELNYDSLMIYDAPNTNSGYLGKWHGTNSPGTILAQNPSGALTFKFKSDYAVNRNGWVAKVTCYIPPQHDLAVVDINPKFIIAGNTVKPRVTIKNKGLNGEGTWSVTVTSKTGYTSTKENVALIPAMGTYIVEMDNWTPAEGIDTLRAVVSLAGDEDTLNNILAVRVDITRPTYTLNATKKTYNIINLANGQELQVASGLTTSPFPMAEEFDGDNIYRLRSDLTIGTVAPDGQFTQIGTITGASGTPTGLAYDWVNDKWFMTIVNSNNQTGLFELNMATLQVTQIGSYATPLIVAIDFANDGFLYGPSISDDKLYKINPTTGAFTEIGAVGLNLNYGQDVTWDPQQQKLYTVTALASGTHAFGYYNLQTGAFTQIATKGSDQYATIVSTRDVLTRYPITFYVSDGTNPLANAKITVGNTSFFTGANGYVTKKYANGTYNFTVEKYGYAPYSGQFTVASVADTIEVTLQLLPIRNIKLHVVNFNNQPIAGALVTVKSGNVLVLQKTTNAAGDIDTALYIGNYTYKAVAEGFVDTTGTFTLSGGSTDTTINISMREIIWMPYGLLTQQLNNEADVKLSWNNELGFFDDIESYQAFSYQQIGNYTLFDGDGSQTYSISNVTFPNQGYVGSAIVFKPSATTPALTAAAWQPKSGLQYIAFFNATTPPNNDWLITPKVTAAQGMKFSFWAKSVTAQYGLERMKVGISTAANPLPVSNYTFLTPNPYVEVPADNWTYYEYDLTPYAGQDVYLAINCVSNDAFVLMIDDIKVGFNIKGAKPVVKYNVYLDGDFVGETTAEEYIYQNLQNGDYTAGVEGVFQTGVSQMAMVNFTVTGVVDNKEVKINYLVYPNPTSDFVSVMYKGAYRLEVTDLTGKVLVSTNAQNFTTVDLRKLSSGVYLLKIYSDKDQYVTKLIKR